MRESRTKGKSGKEERVGGQTGEKTCGEDGQWRERKKDTGIKREKFRAG